MHRRSLSRLLLVMVMMFAMMMSVLPVRVSAESSPTDWTPVTFSEIADGDHIAVTMSKDSSAWILPAAATGKTPAPDTASVTDGALTADPNAYAWTFTAAEGGFTLGSSGGYLNSGNSNNGLRANGEAAVWTQDAESGYLKEISTGRYMGVRIDTNNVAQDWRAYTSINANIAGQTVSFWKYNGTIEPDPEPTEEPEIALSTIAEALAGENGTAFKVKGVVTLVDGRNIYIQDETGGIDLYLPAADTSVALGDTLIGQGNRAVYRGLPELADAVIEKSEGLTLTAKETTIGALTAADVCTYVQVKNLEVTEVNDGGGSWTNPNLTLKDESGASIAIYRAVVNKTDGAWDLKTGDKVNVKAAVGINNTTLQLRNTLAEEIEKISEPGPEPDPEDPYADIDPTLSVYELQAAPADGDTVVIYNAANKRGVKGELKASYYLDSAELTAENRIIASDAEMIEWKVTANEDGTFTFTQDDKTLAGKQSPNGDKFYNNLSLSAEDSVKWELIECNAENSSWYVSNPAMASTNADQGGKVYLEWYARYTEFSLYDTLNISEDAFGFTFYKLVREKKEGIKAPEADTASGEVAKGTVVTFTSATEGAVIYYSTDNGTAWTEGSTYTVNEDVTLLVKAVKGEEESKVSEFTYTVKEEVPQKTLLNKLEEAPADGSKIAIYHPASKMVLTSAVSGKKLAGEEAALEEGRLPLTDTMAYLNVSVADGLYTFEYDGKYLTSPATGNGLSFADDGTADLAKWTLEQQADGTWYAINAAAEYNGTKQALEYYSGFTTYGVKDSNDAYKFEFYGESETAAETGLVTDLSQLKDGSYVVIYNQGNSVAMSSETYNDWYLLAAEATIENNQAVNPAADLIWKVNVAGDGTYSFTQGEKAVTAWLSGNYVELTNNPAHEGASVRWNIKECNPETSAWYIYSSDLTTSYGNAYIEAFYKKHVDGVTFCGYSTSEEKLTEKDYGMQMYLVDYKEPEPSEKGDLVTDLSQLKDGAQVSIYSPSHKTAISSKPNGDWYLKANEAKVENNKVVNFTADMVWTVKVNEDGTYSFYAYNDDTRSITVWPSGNYAELSVDAEKYPDNKWHIAEAKTEDCFYINSTTVSGANGPAYIEAYIRNDFEVFSGYFTTPSSSRFTESEFALQFYLVNGEEALDAYDDGEWDGILNKGEKYVIHNVAADSTIGLLDQANFSMKAIPSEVTDGKTPAGNGTYVFTVDTMGRYYSFMTGGKYMATNDAEEMLLLDPNEDGSVPENAKWFLRKKEGTSAEGEAISGYILYNKEAQYGGTPVCIEYYSSVFSGWTFSSRNDLAIYLFNFCKLTDDAVVYNDIVQDPSVLFGGGDFRYVTQDYNCDISLDDLADTITSVTITYECGPKSGTVEDVAENNNKSYSFSIPADAIDSDEKPEFLTITVTVTNSYGITYTAEKIVENMDEPFLEGHTPEPNEQTGDDKRPTVSAYIRNAGENPTVEMYLNGEKVEAVFENSQIIYTPSEDMEDGTVVVEVKVVREDGKSVMEAWTFTVGTTGYQLYFGQLHSHTTYSDGSGTLDAALDYVASLPESANVDFVAFTDHSNYFDTTSAANPADAMNDASLMTEASRALWAEYKDKVAKFNEKQSDIVAIAGFEMTWSGGPGHINSFNTQGLVSRNNAELNNKTNDAGMKLYYQTMNKDSGETMHQFNHPGSTFGNFTDFSYWDEQTDDHMFLVEVGNGEGQIGAGGYYPSYEEYTLALDHGWHVAPTNNQDNHKGRWGNANDARDVILADNFSEQGIYEAIRARRVYATEDKNLEIHYQLNDSTMGSILEDLDPSEKINITVSLYDPDKSDSISKVEVIANAGAVAYTWDNAEDLARGIVTAELDPQYTYYYIRVTQADGDLAVTAPVWTGKAAKIGIDEITYTPETALVNQEVTLHTALYNNEYPDATVKSMVYTTDGGKVLGTDTEAKTLEGEGTLNVPFTFTPDTAKRMTITVTAVIDYEGTELKVSKEVAVSVREKEGPLPLTDIKDVQAVTEEGYEFAIEGIVTSNASGYDKDTAFFDCIYVQDETGGICCFPVSGEYKIGDKVHIEGYTDFYQGEAELQVVSIEVIGSGTVEPKEVTAKEINDLSVLGSLVTVKGTVESVEKANDLIQTIMVKDAEGNTARVFIDGYITASYEVENCVVGAEIAATGLSSYDDTWPDTDYFARIRIRDRKDVVCSTGFTVEPAEAEMPTVSTLQLTASKDAVWTSSDESIATVDENTGFVKAHRYGKVTITATAKDNPALTATSTIQTRFFDVNDPAKYYYRHVYWAAENKVTMGYDRVYFGPERTCTRRELAIFLWRVAGRPEAQGTMPFSDMGKYGPSTDTYKAVLWAYTAGIVKGYSNNTFRPEASVIRKDTMIMLYRLAGKPAVSGTLAFDDVKALGYGPDTDTYKSVVWGTENAITKGYADGSFKPLANCLREHIVTFISRYDELNRN